MGKKKKKKNKSNPPKHTRLNRTGRLQAAKHWIPTYEGKNTLKGYSKHFGVDKLCALHELEILGYTFSETYKQSLRSSQIQKQRDTEKRKEAKEKKRQMEEEFWGEDSDETFAFIAGFTEGGAPYGITWEELDLLEGNNKK